MHIQDSQRTAAADSDGGGGAEGGAGGHRPAPLRVDAQRNLEHVLRAAREVFGELGYGAPMEDVARRARVGVGTVYRRFPSKDVLVKRIAEEETARLTEQARTALGQEDDAWAALARFLRTSAASGAGRLLPPQMLRVQGSPGAEPREEYGRAYGPGGSEAARVPQQRTRLPLPGEHGDEAAPTDQADHAGREHEDSDAAGRDKAGPDQDSVRALLDVVGQLVDRAREAGELRGDVSVADVLLVIATAAPALPDAAQQAAASSRLLDILLEGLRSRPGERIGDRAGERSGEHTGSRTSERPGEPLDDSGTACG
jgi:AcrR family transcriptional regulator